VQNTIKFLTMAVEKVRRQLTTVQRALNVTIFAL
jgi:hypothetical protein